MIKTKPYRHQEKAIEYIKDKNYFALFCDPGTGKSRILIEKALLCGVNNLLIICPNYLKINWAQQLETHCGAKYFYMIWDGFSTKKSMEAWKGFLKLDGYLKVFIVNVESFQSASIEPFIKQFNADFVCIDESVTIKNPAAKRTDSIMKLTRSAKYKAILSGTPCPNSPVDLYSQFEFLSKGFWGCSFFQFKHSHCILMTQEARGNKFLRPIDEGDFTRVKKFLSKYETVTSQSIYEASIRFGLSERNIISINSMSEYTPFKDLDKIDRKINPITFKIKKSDCLDLPPKIYESIICEASTDQKRILTGLKKGLQAEYNGRELNIPNIISFIIRARMVTSGVFPFLESPDLSQIDLSNFDFDQIFNLSTKKGFERIKPNPKLNALISDLETIPPDESIIIWSNFVESIRYIHDGLKEAGYYSEMYYGDTSEAERARIIEDFKSGKVKIIIMNPLTGGMGLNLQNCTLQYFFDNSYRSDIRVQCEDRSHRIGQNKPVLYKDIIIEKSIDETIIEILKRKIGLLDYFRGAGVKDVFAEKIIW